MKIVCICPDGKGDVLDELEAKLKVGMKLTPDEADTINELRAIKEKGGEIDDISDRTASMFRKHVAENTRIIGEPTLMAALNGKGNETFYSVKAIEDDPTLIDDADWVYLNIASNVSDWVSRAKKVAKEQGKKILANIDFSLDIVFDAYANPVGDIVTLLAGVDKVFYVDHDSTHTLQVLLNREVEYIPHPIDFDYVKTFKRCMGEKNNDKFVTFIYHNFDKSMLTYYIALSTVLRANGYTTVLCGVIGESDMEYMRPAFDRVYGRAPNSEYLSLLGMSKFVIDLYSITSIHRTAMECAAVGTLFLGVNNAKSTAMMWDTMFYKTDIKSILGCVNNMTTKEYNRVVSKAHRFLMGGYSFEAVKRNMIKFLEREDVDRKKTSDEEKETEQIHGPSKKHRGGRETTAIGKANAARNDGKRKTRGKVASKAKQASTQQLEQGRQSVQKEASNGD